MSVVVHGTVKELKLARLDGENTANFKVDNQPIMVYLPRAVIRNGDDVIIAGKLKDGLLISYGLNNITQNVVLGPLTSQTLINNILGSMFGLFGLFILLGASGSKNLWEAIIFVLIALVPLGIGISIICYSTMKTGQRDRAKSEELRLMQSISIDS